MDEVVLTGGIGNAGQVIRIANEVHRPAAPNQAVIDTYLEALRAAGFDAVPVPLGPANDGRVRHSFIPGEVPVPPYPEWALTEVALASVARLLRKFHEAAAIVGLPAEAVWSDELNDPRGGSFVIHNDLCPENTLFSAGEAVAMIDFEFAAPGDPLWDLAGVARMWGTIGDPVGGRPDGQAIDPQRLAVVTQAYGLDPARADDFLDTMLLRDRVGRAFVERHVAAGEPAFVQMWSDAGGGEKRDRERAWIEANRAVLIDAICREP